MKDIFHISDQKVILDFVTDFFRIKENSIYLPKNIKFPTISLLYIYHFIIFILLEDKQKSYCHIMTLENITETQYTLINYEI